MFVVATDSALSGWGGVATSFVAIEANTDQELDQATAWLNNRPEMKRVRLNLALPSIRSGDNLAIWNATTHPHVFGGNK